MWGTVERLAGLRSVRYIKEVGLCLAKRSSIPSVHEPVKLQTVWVDVHLHCFVHNGQQFSAVSDGKPVEAFCRDWFGESCEDSSGQADMDQRGQSRRHGDQ